MSATGLVVVEEHAPRSPVFVHELPLDEGQIEPTEPDHVTIADAAHDAARLQRGIQRRVRRRSPGVPISGARA